MTRLLFLFARSAEQSTDENRAGVVGAFDKNWMKLNFGKGTAEAIITCRGKGAKKCQGGLLAAKADAGANLICVVGVGGFGDVKLRVVEFFQPSGHQK